MVERLLYIFIAITLQVGVFSQGVMLPSEKIYAHLDRDHYTSGDRIYYKIYLTDDHVMLGKAVSKVIYVDLVDLDSNIVISQTLHASDGIAIGDLVVSFRWHSGKYLFRAYTDYSLNFQKPAYFTRPIEIHANSGVSTIDTNCSATTKVQFFPEGGHLIHGLPTRIGIKSEHPIHGGRSIQGYLLDPENNREIYFETDELGFGSLSITPALGKTYRCQVSTPEGDTDVIFPEIHESGITISTITASDDVCQLQLKSTSHFRESSIRLVGYHRNQQILELALSCSDTIIQFANEQLPAGINIFTVYDEMGRPQSECVTFNYEGIDNYNIDFTKVFEGGQRQLVDMTIDLYDDEGEALDASLSYNVVDQRYLDKDNCGDIRSYFWLESELQGPLQQPCRYFDGPTSELRKRMDLLLLTHGWRQFVWKKQERIRAPEQGLSIQGRIVDVQNNASGVVAEGYLSELSQRLDLVPFLTDDQGYFRIDDLDHHGVTNFILQAQKYRPSRKERNPEKISLKGNRNVEILLLDKAPAPIFIPKHMQCKRPNEDRFNYLVDNAFTISEAKNNWDGLIVDLPAVEVTASKIVHPAIDLYQPGMLYQRPDQRIMVDDIAAPSRYSGLHGVFNLLKAHISGAQFSNLPSTDGIEFNSNPATQDGPSVLLRGAASIHSSTQRNDAAAFLLNGAQVPSSVLLSLSPQRIAFIDVITSLSQLASYGSLGSGGIIAIYLKPPGVGSNQLLRQKGLLNFSQEGFYDAREFYSPSYDTQNDTISRDDRVTLYWEPDLQCYEGEARTRFYTSDRKANYSVILQGITSRGLPVYAQTQIIVD